MYLNILLSVVFLFCIGFLLNGGLWSNALTLINVVTAALIATNYWEPLAQWLEGQAPSYTYLWDFLSLWAIFGLTMLVFQTATDTFSKVKVRFRSPVNQAGGILLACWIGWMMVCFTTFTLHTAPLARNFLAGSFQPTPEARMFFGLAPDRRWLAFVQKVSTGAFSRGGTPENPYPYKFDPEAKFIFKYAERRARYESEPGIGAKSVPGAAGR